ncbi:hypothetical protein J437_LFUL001405 [Ladona fulva]|uniref:Uncharacterized protein n=1 Tax=Ladona fulva TaxID=123851 RepID=A0A8K0NW30_LADFU|nr:hypothetical protein J437_LFUL001405 [Ladona fulva]
MESGIGLALPVLGSTHVVDLSLWSMKNTLPLGATCKVQPSGRPFELGIVTVVADGVLVALAPLLDVFSLLGPSVVEVPPPDAPEVPWTAKNSLPGNIPGHWDSGSQPVGRDTQGGRLGFFGGSPASYEIALEVAKNKKPHTIAETLIKPCLIQSVKLVLGEANKKGGSQTSFKNLKRVAIKERLGTTVLRIKFCCWTHPSQQFKHDKAKAESSQAP